MTSADAFCMTELPGLCRHHSGGAGLESDPADGSVYRIQADRQPLLAHAGIAGAIWRLKVQSWKPPRRKNCSLGGGALLSQAHHGYGVRPEGCVIIHMIARSNRGCSVSFSIPAINSKETLEAARKIKQRYGIEVEYSGRIPPSKSTRTCTAGVYKTNPDQCCAIAR